MKRSQFSMTVGGLCLMLFVALGLAQNTTQAPRAKPMQKPAQQQTNLHEERREHPNISSALQHLNTAKSDLMKAKHDFGGHRAAALEHVNQAIQECQRALEYSQKQE